MYRGFIVISTLDREGKPEVRIYANTATPSPAVQTVANIDEAVRWIDERLESVD
jgi:DNA-binding PadR family transcriptional regulator